MNTDHDQRDAAENDESSETKDSAGMMGLGMALGVGVGSIFGLAIDNLALGMGVGIAIGAGVGAALASRK